MTLERAAWVVMSGVKGLGPARFRQVIEQFGTALAALEADAEQLTDLVRLPESAIQQLTQLAPGLEAAEAEILALEEQGIRPLLWQDDEYPSALLATGSPPPVLWWTGSVDPNSRPMIAGIGSREASTEALEWAHGASAELTGAGAVVVSGLAAGIDASFHQGALDAGGLTVGVCGCGIATALARGHGGLAGSVAEAGSLCSELSPSAPLLPQALFARDRIIAGLAGAVLVVEARPEGGAVHTAKCALQEGRPVVVVAWGDSSSAGGNAQLLAEGAIPLDPAANVLSVLDTIR